MNESNDNNPQVKEKKPTKKEKVIYNPSYKFPKIKIPNQVYKQIEQVKELTPNETLKYLTAIALGAIPDRFGMEPSLDTKLKALEQISKITQINETTDGEMEAGIIVDDIPTED